MNSEKRLDALLTALHRAERRPSHRDDATDTIRQRARLHSAGELHQIQQAGEAYVPRELADDDELAPLVATAQRVASLRTPLSDPAVTQAIKARVLARATERRQQGEVTPRRERDRQQTHTTPTTGWGVLRPALVAAVVILVAGVSTVVAAAQASPGSPLFALHRVEQSVRANVVPDSATRARQHMQFAREWLATLHTAASQPLGDAAYADALRALGDEDAAAAREIAHVPPGAQRTALETDLATLRTDERTMLRATLSTTSWPNRIAATTALGALGATVPHVTGATLIEDDGDHWRVTLTGTGFQPGALLLVNGQPTGTVIATSNDMLTAELTRAALAQPLDTLGVGNPDGTAAVTSSVRLQQSGAATETPDQHPQLTPTPEHDETPTATVPTATATPEVPQQPTPGDTGG